MYDSNFSETNFADDFEKELSKPLNDLLYHIKDQNVSKAIDIGCGSGWATEFVVKLFPNATVSGFDISKDAINSARERLPTINFFVENITEWRDNETYDLIMANAVLHWVPNHRKVLKNLVSKLRLGGTLAIQMPDNSNEPALKSMNSISASSHLVYKLQKFTYTDPRLTPELYYEILVDNVRGIEIWRTTYFHEVNGGIKGLINWFKSFGLQRILNRLDTNEQKYFLDQYELEVSKFYPVHKNGKILVPFPRVFIIAIK